MHSNIRLFLISLAVSVFLSACNHPLVPVGNGDIISSSATRNCTLEDYQAYAAVCDENIVTEAYTETYSAIPRAGWRFKHWENSCENETTNQCSFSVTQDIVEEFFGETTPPLIAVFAPDLLFYATDTPPFDIGAVSATYAPDVPYGPDVRNVFDIYMPDSTNPTPLIIRIHGGGFTGGDKAIGSNFDQNIVRTALANSTAYASINYRLIMPGNVTEGVIKSLSDSERALRYLRLHADSFNIDPERIAIYGGSAGAGTTHWIGTKDDTANPRDPDPLKRQSTRISAMGLVETQATYDLVRWEDIYSEFGITLVGIAAVSQALLQQLLDFYGVTELDDIYTPEITAYRDSVDMLDLMSSDDPPLWISSTNIGPGFPTSTNALLHHPYFHRAVRDQADVVGMEHVTYIPQLGISDPSGETLADFLIRHLTE